MKQQILSRKPNPTNADRPWAPLLQVFIRRLLVVVLLLNCGSNVRAQSPEPDTSANHTEQVVTYAKLGARVAVGGLYGYGLDQGELYVLEQKHTEYLRGYRPKYGVQASVLIPFGAKCDFEAVAAYAYFPGSYSSNQDLDLPLLKTGNFRVGFRWYKRRKELEPKIASMRWAIRRMFWRERVDRSGFHFGLNMGTEVGWHTRIIRTMPEDWPANELLTESDMEHNVVDYSRWYWHGSIQVGCTFSGRVDLTIGIDAAARNREVSLGFPVSRAYLTGCISIVLGRSHIK